MLASDIQEEEEAGRKEDKSFLANDLAVGSSNHTRQPAGDISSLPAVEGVSDPALCDPAQGISHPVPIPNLPNSPNIPDPN